MQMTHLVCSKTDRMAITFSGLGGPKGARHISVMRLRWASLLLTLLAVALQGDLTNIRAFTAHALFMCGMKMHNSHADLHGVLSLHRQMPLKLQHPMQSILTDIMQRLNVRSFC